MDRKKEERMDSCDTQGKREPAEESLERRTLHDFGYFGHFLHVYEGGRGGKQHILSKLYYRDGHLTQRELLEATSISSAALSEVLSKLECEGLITRSRSDQDKRQQVILLTDEGHTRAEETVRAREEFEAMSLGVLTEDEKVALVDMLDRVRAHWREIEGRKAECKRN